MVSSIHVFCSCLSVTLNTWGLVLFFFSEKSNVQDYYPLMFMHHRNGSQFMVDLGRRRIYIQWALMEGIVGTWANIHLLCDLSHLPTFTNIALVSYIVETRLELWVRAKFMTIFLWVEASSCSLRLQQNAPYIGALKLLKQKNCFWDINFYCDIVSELGIP